MEIKRVHSTSRVTGSNRSAVSMVLISSTNERLELLVVLILQEDNPDRAYRAGRMCARMGAEMRGMQPTVHDERTAMTNG
jgi:hypothetical protein